MLIDRGLVVRIARLASLEHSEKSGERIYDEQSLDVLAGELQKILNYVEEISALPVDDVPKTQYGVPVATRFREDETEPTLSPDDALANAASRSGDHLMVPRVIEES